MNFENIMLSKRSHVIYWMIPIDDISKIGKLMETESILVVSKEWRNGEIGSDC